MSAVESYTILARAGRRRRVFRPDRRGIAGTRSRRIPKRWPRALKAGRGGAMVAAMIPAAPARYATRPERSRGRLHPEPESPTRSVFQRDRDRIVHSAAFRRLEYKTQVFVHHEGDHYRTRLTHSLEVAQIARSVSRELGLDEDLAEAVALAHDLGHTPFGHAGGDALDAAMTPFGGFDHNAQALRVLTDFERRYAAFDGLNLTWETLEGVAKHNGPIDPDTAPAALAAYNRRHDLELGGWPGPEAQAAAHADDIAWCNHDIDDALRAGLFDTDALAAAPLAGPIAAEVAARHPGIARGRLAHEVVRRLIDAMVVDLVGATRARARRLAPRDAAAVRALGEPLAGFSAAMRRDMTEPQGVPPRPRLSPPPRQPHGARSAPHRPRPVRAVPRRTRTPAARPGRRRRARLRRRRPRRRRLHRRNDRPLRVDGARAAVR